MVLSKVFKVGEFMEPIRVLQVVPNMHAAGLETLIMNLYRNIDRTKIQFDFLVHYTQKYFYDDEIESLGGHIYRLSFREDNNLIKYVKDLDKFFTEHNQYYIVHGHMASTAFFYLSAAKKHHVPIRILHSHNTSTEKNLKGLIKQQMLKISTRYANTYYACGIMAGNFLYGNKNFEVINNAIDLERFKKDSKLRANTRKKYGLNDCFVIGHIGRFNSQKNHKFIIDVFEQYYKKNSSARLVLVGEGELESSIKQIVKDKKLLDVVKFLGVLKDTEAIYNMFDVFLLPSLFEGMPVVGVEVQACECNAILSDKITKEVKLTNYISYLPIEGEDAALKWVDKISQLEKNKVSDDEVYKKLTKAGFNIKEEAKRLEEKYLDLIQKKGDK